MNTTLTLMDLGGAIALLIWGVHMVQTGITRAFGPQLRRMLSYALGNRKWRTVFSTTTMASSTRMPMEKISANNVTRFRV